ncbi:putative membrane protein [Acinetobacter baumannii 348935]|nr:putative membrane protein [Acinetobacter baumannii 348935]
METLKTMSVSLMLLIALSLSIGGLWHQLQSGSMFYTLI